MRTELSSIKLGDRVVYAVGGVEYNALALGTASEGWSQGIRLGTISLSLTYLNEFGVQVKVLAAPLLGVAADDQHLKGIAQQAAEKTFGYVTAHDDVKAQMVAEQLANVKANPRTNGWRPYVEGEEVSKLRAQLALAAEMIGKLNDALNQPEDEPAQPAGQPGLPSAEDLDAVEAEKALSGSAVQDEDTAAPTEAPATTDAPASQEGAPSTEGA